MVTVNEVKAKMKSLGFSNEEFLRMWFEIYVLSNKKEDLHASFACKLGCSRNDAKCIHWFLLYSSPYLKDLLRTEGICRLEQAKIMVMKQPDKVSAENRLNRQIEFLEKLHDKYVEIYRTINCDSVK